MRRLCPANASCTWHRFDEQVLATSLNDVEAAHDGLSCSRLIAKEELELRLGKHPVDRFILVGVGLDRLTRVTI